MKRLPSTKLISVQFCIILITGLLLLPGCDNKPPLITDCDSFIANLRHAGLEVEATEIDEEAETFAERYVRVYRKLMVLDIEGIIIDPEFLEESNEYLRPIEEQISNIKFSGTILSVNGEKVKVYEYKDAVAADTDAGYIDVERELTIPTNMGIMKNVISSLKVGPTYYFKKDRIIVIFTDPFTEIQSRRESRDTILGILRELLGPELLTR